MACGAFFFHTLRCKTCKPHRNDCGRGRDGYAARDAADGDAGAAAWFLSAGYRWYLELLGLPPEWLPAGVTRADLAGMVEAAASRRARATSSGRRSTWAAMSQNVA